MTGPEPPREVELDPSGDHVARHLSTLASTGMAVAQITAHHAATQARTEQATLRDQQRAAEQQTRAAQAAQREQQRIAEQHARTLTATRHAQWRLQPTTGWLYDDPAGAARAWYLANLNRDTDPLAARYASAWETVFTREGLHVPALRSADAVDAEALIVTAARAAAPPPRQPESPEPPREPATASTDSPEPIERTDTRADTAPTTADQAGTAAEAMVEATVEGAAESVAAAAAAGWTAYADGAPAAALGGAGVSHPTTEVLPATRATPDSAANAAVVSPQVTPELGAAPTHAPGLEQ